MTPFGARQPGQHLPGPCISIRQARITGQPEDKIADQNGGSARDYHGPPDVVWAA